MIANHRWVYGALTVMLTLFYVGGVVLLQALFRSFTGQGSQLAVIASTLAFAVLLNRPRRWIQASISDSLHQRNLARIDRP